MSMITTILFDWGGVLIDDPAPGLLSILSRTLGVSPEQFTAAMKRYGAEFQTGRFTEAQFWQAMCGEMGVAVPQVPSLWGATFREIYRPKRVVWDLARTLKKNGYKIGLLSNTEIPGVEYFRATQPKIFDELIFSCCEGCHKPEAKIYELALSRLKSKPEEAVFIDDRPDYAQGAKNVGIHPILFTSPAAVRRELETLGVKTT